MKTNKGFTLIELLVVVLIIGILVAVAIPQYQVAVAKSRASELFIHVKALKTAIDAYILETGSWPLKFADLDIEIANAAPFTPCATSDCIANDRWLYTLQSTITFVDGRPKTSQDLSIGWNGDKATSSAPNSFICSVLVASPSLSINRKVCKSLGGVLVRSDVWEYYKLSL